MSPGAVAVLVTGVSLASILQACDCGRVSILARHYFPTYITATARQQDFMQNAVLGLSELVTYCW